MKALLLKEFKELWLTVVAFIAAAGYLGLMDLAYNWNEKRIAGLSLGFCWLMGIVVSLLGGAHALGRETRAHLTFLSSWPVTRRQIWLAKLVSHLLAVVVLIAGAFSLCALLLSLHGFSIPALYADIVPLPFRYSLLLYLALFCFGFMWSVLVREPLAAAGLAALTMGLTAAALLYPLLAGLTGSWLPSVQARLAMLPAGQARTLAVGMTLLLSLMALACSAWAFLRLPVLEGRRRGALALGAYAGAMLAVAAVTFLALTHALVPHLTAGFIGVTVDPTGQWVALYTQDNSLDRSGEANGLWITTTQGRGLKLISRGSIDGAVFSPDGRKLCFARAIGRNSDSSGEDWRMVDLQTGRAWRLGGEVSAYLQASGVSVWSPRGTYMVVGYPDGCWLSDGRRQLLRLPPVVSVGYVLGWSPDERKLYVRPSDQTGHSRPAAFVELTVPQLTERTIAIPPGGGASGRLSPDARWIVITVWPAGARRTSDAGKHMLLETATGAVRPLPDLGSLGWNSWSADSRYLWVVRREPLAPGKWRHSLLVLDVKAMRVIRTITPEDLGGQDPEAYGVREFSPHGGGTWIVAHGPPPPGSASITSLWQVKEDGSGLRLISRTTADPVAWTTDGDIIATRTTPIGQDAPNLTPQPAATTSLVRINPATGAERVIFQLPPAPPPPAGPG